MKARIVIRGFLLAAAFVVSAQPVAAQFVEDFGHAGTVRKFQGQIRDSLDDPVSGAKVTITNVATQKVYNLNANDEGVFQKGDLPGGKYEVRVSAMGFNFAEYTIRIAPSGGKLYIITRLSPGCASGDSGVVLVRRLKDRSITDEN